MPPSLSKRYGLSWPYDEAIGYWCGQRAGINADVLISATCKLSDTDIGLLAIRAGVNITEIRSFKLSIVLARVYKKSSQDPECLPIFDSHFEPPLD